LFCSHPKTLFSTVKSGVLRFGQENEITNRPSGALPLQPVQLRPSTVGGSGSIVPPNTNINEASQIFSSAITQGKLKVKKKLLPSLSLIVGAITSTMIGFRIKFFTQTVD
jgi:hypothetical protein